MAQPSTTTYFTGSLYLTNGDGIIYADGHGLKAASVPYGTIHGGTATYVPTYDAQGVLTSGVALSDTPSAGAIVKYDSSGGLCSSVLFNIAQQITQVLGNLNVQSNAIITGPVTCAYSTVTTNAATVQYVLDQISQVAVGYTWLVPVISFWDGTSGYPPTPTDGDRYICSVVGTTAWTLNHVYTYDGGSATWTDYGPQINDAVTDKSGPTSYIYTNPSGTAAWNVIGFNGSHDQLIGEEHTNSASTNILNLTSPITPLTNGTALLWQTPSNLAWTGEIRLVGVSGTGLGMCVYKFEVELLNVAGVLTCNTAYIGSSVSGNLSTATVSLAVDGTHTNYLNALITRNISDGQSSTWHATYFTTFTNVP
jgi:hypothetical protein